MSILADFISTAFPWIVISVGVAAALTVFNRKDNKDK